MDDLPTTINYVEVDRLEQYTDDNYQNLDNQYSQPYDHVAGNRNSGNAQGQYSVVYDNKRASINKDSEYEYIDPTTILPSDDTYLYPSSPPGEHL